MKKKYIVKMKNEGQEICCHLRFYMMGKLKTVMQNSTSPKAGISTTVKSTGATKKQCCAMSMKKSFPMFRKKQDSLPLSCANQVALCIFDVFRAHRIEAMLKKLHDARIRTVFVPASCTGELQPLDLHVNSVFKTQLRSCFTEWYSEQVTTAMRAGKSTADPIDLRIFTLKPIYAKWLLKSYCHLEANPAIIRKGFHDAGNEEAAQLSK